MPEPVLTLDEYRQLVEQSPILTWRADLSKACDYFNARWLAFTGRTMEQELGFGWAEGVHPDDFERCLAVYTTAFDAREVFEMEYRLRRADSAWRWVFDRGVPYSDESGDFAGYIGSCIDISDQVEGRAARERVAELELRELKGLLPICASCKRVRDDQGYWRQVELYVQQHSSAQFTHGICPSCMTSEWSELDAADATQAVEASEEV
jgi:PAS domain S-box-containing protein